MPEFAAALAAADPHAVALADHYRDLTWTEVNDTLNRCANLLLAMDLGPKRRVSIFAENAGETALAHLGGLLAGCSTVPEAVTVAVCVTAAFSMSGCGSLGR